ncbi:MAG: paraquat-inducible protein A [Herbaspirillum sp.]
MTDPRLTACHDCDLLQRVPILARGEQARCVRCGARLARRPRSPMNHTLAYALAAVVTFAIGNAYPVVTLETQGLETHATLLGAVQALHRDGMDPVAGLVLLTGFAAPLVLMLSLIYLLLPLQLGRVAPGFTGLYRFFLAVSPWAMVEVMMLGVVVSFVKLAHMATAMSGIGLWSLGLTMLLMAAMTGSMDRADIWLRYEARRAGKIEEARA